MSQLSITGDDWLSESEKKRAKKAIAVRKKKAILLARKLESASDAMNEYLGACRDCQDGTTVKDGNGVDGRVQLIRQMTEFASYLDMLYGEKAA